MIIEDMNFGHYTQRGSAKKYPITIYLECEDKAICCEVRDLHRMLKYINLRNWDMSVCPVTARIGKVSTNPLKRTQEVFKYKDIYEALRHLA